jgi:hypothetical protein
MTAKIDGTNGVLQQYDYQTPTTGFSYTFAAGTQMLFMVPAGTLATGTITMPASPADGMVITFSSSQQITALTVQGNTGQSISSAATFLPAKGALSYVYRLSNTTWYPCQTVPNSLGSQLVSETSKPTTSGTSVEFTGIPSWVKRITVMFNGVGTNGTAPVLVQLGTGSTPTYTTSGYKSYVLFNGGTTSSTYGLTTVGVGAGDQRWGSMIISTSGSNNWAEVVGNAVGTNGGAGGGGIALGGQLTALRLIGSTTGSPVDTFDEGSVNILYE